jgi:CIC family chloride channel protein
MAAMMGGTMRSPLTGMVFALELTHDINAMPALLIGSVAALGVTVLLMRRSILTEKLARRGQHIAREYSVDLFELMRVGDVMDKEVPSVPMEMTVADLSNRIAEDDSPLARRQGTILLDQNQLLAGLITRGDILKALKKDPSGTMSVLEAGSRDCIVTHPDEPLHDALTKMLKHDIGRLPVVDLQAPGRVIGYLGRASIVAARARYHAEEEVRERGPLLRNVLRKEPVPGKS